MSPPLTRPRASSHPQRRRGAPPKAARARAALLAASATLLVGCPRPCAAGEPLGPLPEPARWVARANDLASAPSPSGDDAARATTTATLSLYGVDGRLINERWLDGDTSWLGATGRVRSTTSLPWESPDGQVTLFLDQGPRAAVFFRPRASLPTSIDAEAPSFAQTPASGGQLIDLAVLGDGTALATRRGATDAMGRPVGAVVLWLDLVRGTTLGTLGLTGIASGEVRPGRIAAIRRRGAAAVATRAVVGLSFDEPTEPGAVAIVDPRGGVTRVNLPEGLTGCAEVAPLSPSPSGASRVAVLCAGDTVREPGARTGAGLALLSIDGPAAPVITVRRASTIFRASAPSRDLVGLSGAWVAAVSGGTTSGTRPDVLLAVDLASDAATELFSESASRDLGPGLGSGDFDPATSELWWPSASGGILRYRFDRAGTDSSFAALPFAGGLQCSRRPIRVVRSIAGGGATPPAPDAGVPDGGADQDAGAPDDAGAFVDAGDSMDGSFARDAGTDAGPPDAGPPDTGPPDSGPPDTGPPDSGPPDAGPGFDSGFAG